MSRNRAGIFWGLVLLIMGGLFLLQNFDIINVNVWNLIWPVMLIAVGLSIIFGMFRGGQLDVEQASVPLNGVESAHVIVEHGVGKANLLGSTEGNTLMSGTFGGGIDARLKQDGGTARLRLKRADHGWFFPFGGWNDSDWTWDFYLTNRIPLTVRVKGSAGMLNMDMADLKVRELKVEGGVGTSEITLPRAAGQTDVKIDGGVGTVTITIPEGVAARIKTSDGLGTTHIPDRFPMAGNHRYESPDFETAENKVDIKVAGGVGTITIL